MVNFTGNKRRKVDNARTEQSEETGSGKTAANLDVLSPEEFLEDWEMEAREAKEQVIGQTMWFEGQRSGDIVTRIFCEATPKHVRKELLIDWYSRLVSDWTNIRIAFMNPLTNKKIQEIAKRKEEMWRQMKACGVDLKFTNPPKNIFESIWPVTGRNHLKAAGVDKSAFYFGGFNYGNLEKNLADFMVKFTDPKIVGKLINQWERVNSRSVLDDYEEVLSDEYSLLVDGGKVGKSIILNRAVGMIDKSKAFALATTSDLVPDNSLAVALDQAAKRGVKVEDICGEENVFHKWPINNLHLFWLVGTFDKIAFKIRRYQIPVLINKKRGVHAKLLIVDGQMAMFGTHNLTDKGVKAGTKEWMIITKNKELIGNLMKFYENLRAEIIET